MPDALSTFRLPGAFGVPHAITHAAMGELRARAGSVASAPDFLARAGSFRAEEPDDAVPGTGGLLRIMGGVGVVSVRGPLFKGTGSIDDFILAMCGGTSYDGIWRSMEAALADSSVKAILLRADSPGGEVTGCGELADFLYSVRGDKPLWTYVEGQCASACYWQASQTDRIIAHHTALAGWIGVIRTIVDTSAMQEKFGVREIEIVSKQSPDKRSIPLDDEVLARQQVVADDLADRFIQTVARGRSLDASDVMARFGGGDGMIANKAVKAGLVDAIGDFNSTLAALQGEVTRPVSIPSRPALAAARATRKERTKMATKSKHRAEAEGKKAEAKSEADAKRAEAEEHEEKAEAKKAQAEDKREEAKSLRADADDLEKDGEHAKAKGKRAEADKCEAEADDMMGESEEYGKKAEAARAEAEDMDKEEKHEEPDGDEGKKAMAALAVELGLTATAKPSEILAAHRAKTAPARDIARLQSEIKALKDRDAERESASLKQRARAFATAAADKGRIPDEKIDLFAETYEKHGEEFASKLLEPEHTFHALRTFTSNGNPRGKAQTATDFGARRIDSRGDAFDAAVKERMKKDGIDYGAAMDRVAREQPDLYRQ